MKIEHLKEFLAVTKSMSFTATAKQFYITQPVLTKHMKSIEAELGISLFCHEGRRVKLTRAGEIFAKSVEGIISDYDSAIVKLNMLNLGFEDRMRVGYLYGAMGPHLSMIWERFAENNPHVMPEFVSMEYDSIIDSLQSDVIDVALAADIQSSLHDACNVREIFCDYVCAVMRSDHPLATKETLSLWDLRDEPFILPHPVHMKGFFDFYGQLLQKAHVVPKTIGYYQELNMRFLSFTNERCVSLMTSHTKQHSLAERGKGTFVYIPLDDESCKLSIAALWKKANNSSIIESFVDEVCAVVPSHFDGACND